MIRQEEIKALKEILSENKDSEIQIARSFLEDIVEYFESHSKIGEWILCSERLPEELFGCLATVIDTNPMTMEDFENILPYHVGYDGKQWNDGDGEKIPFEVIAWQRLPEPYKEVEENEN